MELASVHLENSPRYTSRIRARGRILYDDAYPAEDYWFDFAGDMADSLSDSGNAWLACLVPLAVTIGEPLRISNPVSRQLLENVHELMLIWKRWYPELHVVCIDAEVVDDIPGPVGTDIASFFSGGVDSFFTVLRHSGLPEWPGRVDIRDLLNVWGLDIRLDNPEAYGRMRDTMRKAADNLGMRLIDIATNVRETRWWTSGYGRLSHGACLAAIGLLLENQYGKVLIPSTHPYDQLAPNGSHALTDPLFSTDSTKFMHDGAGFDRVEKTGFVAQSDVAMRSLRVCWKSQSNENCQACNKCYRTMLTLMLHGALDRCSTFDQEKLTMEKVQSVYSSDGNDRALLAEVQAFAAKQGREDVAKAIEASFRHSDNINRCLRWLRPFAGMRGDWRIRQWLFSGSIV